MPLKFAKGFGLLLGYFAICASGALALRRFAVVPAEVFRKTLHFILLGSIYVYTYAFRTWWMASAAAVIFMAIVYPLLAFAERFRASLGPGRRRSRLGREAFRPEFP